MLPLFQLSFFLLASVAIIIISRRCLLKPRSHGFYRFWAWEAMTALLVLNVPAWFRDPFSVRQIFSWLLLCAALYLVIASMTTLRKAGRPDAGRADAELLGLEKTTQLVTGGIYRLIRHPMYGSLLLLTWGIFLKAPGWAGAGLALAASVLLTVTARMEEVEDLRFFGEAYGDYMRRTKMFIPFVF